MADFESNIRIDIDTSKALAAIKNLQSEISRFQTQMNRGSAAQAAQARTAQQELVNGINATGKFSASMRTVQSTAESFTNALEKNKLSMGQYFRYAGASSKRFGRLFSQEFGVIEKTARERVKDLQTQYIKLGRDANGAMKAIAVRPLALDMESLGTQTAMAAQKQQIMNQLLKQGSTNLLNFGKNTQWAGRQLMVGFTIPLSIFGSMAAKSFMQLEEQTIKFRKVYGDLFTSDEERDAALANIEAIADGFTKYGVSVADTVGLAAEAAAAGFGGADLQRQTSEAIKLSVLGQLDQQKALETTISLQNAFGLSSQNLAEAIDFLNAVENQTVVALDDITTAIPKVAPVIKALGGDVKDLAFFLSAMKEGGVNASEGANALKSSLGRLINPTQVAKDMMGSLGINITDIVDRNAGNLRQTLLDLGAALDTLDPLNRSRAIEELFGKFQFARMSTLFDNINRQGNQASRVLDLASYSAAELASISEKELGMTASSSMNQFKKSIEDLQRAIAPVGEVFLDMVTPIISFATDVLDNFNKLDSGVKSFVAGLVAVLGVIGPIALMTFGLLANGVANIIKGFLAVRNIFQKTGAQSQILGEQTDYLTQQQLEEMSVAASLDQIHQKLTQTFTSEASAIDALTAAYSRAIAKQQQFGGPGIQTSIGKPRKMRDGGIISVPGSGKGDKVPAMLEPGEAVIPSEMVSKYAPLINGMIADNIPGYVKGKKGAATQSQFPHVPLGGSYDASHFSTREMTMDAQQALEMLRAAGKEGAAIFKNLAWAIENQGIKTVKVFTNEVVALSSELNREMQYKGKASMDMIRRDLSGPRADAMHIELERQLAKTGMDRSGVKSRVAKINQALQRKLDEFGDTAEMTSDQLNKLISDAYDEVAKTDKEVRAARKEMQKITTIKDPVNRTTVGAPKPGQDRKGLTRESYVDQRNAYGLIATRQGAYGRFGSMGTDPEMAAAVGLSSGREIKAMVDTMTAEQQQQLAELKKAADKAKRGSRDYTAFAEKFNEFAAINNFNVDKQKIAAEAIAQKQEELNAALQGTGITAKIDKRGGTRYFQGGKRISSEVAAQELQRHTAAVKQDTIAEKENTAASRQNTAVQKSSTSVFSRGMQKITGNLGTASFALTSLAGAGMFAGGTIGELSNKLFGITSAMTALIMITELLTKAKLGELVSSRISIAKQAAFGPVVGPKTAAQAATGLGAKFARLGTFVLKLFSPIGLVTLGLTALAGIIAFAIKTNQDQQRSIAELGDSAFMTAEKIKKAGDLLGFTPGGTSFAASLGQGQAAPRTGEQADAITALRENQDFLDSYADEIKALQGATQLEAQKILSSIALGLAASGADAAAVDTFVKALAQEAGQTKLNLNFGEINISSNAQSQVAGVAEEIARLVEEGLTSENQRLLNLQLGLQAQSLEALKIGLQNGLISAEQFYDGMDAVMGVFDDLTDDQLKTAMPFLTKIMGIDEALEGISSVKDQLLIIRASAEGIDTAAAEAAFSADRNDIDNVKAIYYWREKLAEAIGTAADNQEKLNDEEEKQRLFEEAVRTANQTLEERTLSLQRQATVYAFLTEQGFSAAEAFELAGDAALAAGIDAAIGAGIASDEWKQTEENIRLFLAAQANAPQRSAGGGGEKSIFQQATENLKKQREEIANSTTAYNKLRQAGLSVDEAMKIAEDSTLAAAVATTNVNTSKWKTLLGTVKALNQELKSQEIRQLLLEGKQSKAALQNQITVSSALSSLGYTYEQLQQVLSNDRLVDALSEDLEDGKINAKELQWALAQIKQMDALEVELNFTTKEGTEAEFDKIYSEASAYLSAKQTKIELDFKLATKDDRDIVEEAQDSIAGIQFKVDDYEASLEEIADQEEEINKQYDERTKALEDVQKINSRIARQQKSQLSVATALAEGDIAAAARAAQEQQAQDAADAIEAQKEALQASRERALAGITSRSGLTREQIEEKIKDLKQQIFEIEEKTLEPAQERIRLLDIERREANQLVEEQIDKWDRLNNEIDLAKLSDEQLAALYAQADVIKDMLLNWDRIEDKTATLTVVKKEGGSTGGGSGTSSSSGGSSQTAPAPAPAPAAGSAPTGVALNTTKELDASIEASKARVEAIDSKISSAAKQINVLKNVPGMSSVVDAMVKQKAMDAYTKSWELKAQAAMKKKSDSIKVSSSAAPVRYLASGGAVASYMRMGGMLPYKAEGGSIFKPLGTDTVPAMLTPGEFVVRRKAVKSFGVDKLNAINSGTSIGDSVYNYSLSVNVKSDANPDEIARAVMTNIKRVESQRVRGSRL